MTEAEFHKERHWMSLLLIGILSLDQIADILIKETAKRRPPVVNRRKLRD